MLRGITITTAAHLCGAVAATALALGAAYASAQPATVEELTVTGKAPKGPPQTFSYKVTFADLNLRTEEGRKELSHRIRITATYVCKKVGQPDSACEGPAITDAMKQASAAEHLARGHGASWTPGPAWVPPTD